MAQRMTIGEFSRVTHLSIRMLRRYHEQDLLVPTEVDPDTGYRYYSPTQIRPALTVRRFRDLDLPLADLRRFLAAGSADGPDDGTAQQVVAAHLRRLEDRLGRTQRAVEALRELLDPEAERAVALEELPAQRVLAVSLDVPEGAGLDWYDRAMRDLDAAVGERSVLPPGGRYEHSLFTEGHGRATVYLPSEAALAADVPGTVRELHLPRRTAAVATHQGQHDDLDLTYGAVGSFVARNDLRSQDLVEEVYPVGPRDTDQPERWRTVVAWLIAPPHPAA
ncbi:MerR family transcriptional regulator [Streptomyces sp. NPDC056568]|uniref:MerR family transcriptional regulator n=1 Tax=Streptomyces sp. NPDC056568 TaxID=3345866 RepID=UPI0036D169EC